MSTQTCYPIGGGCTRCDAVPAIPARAGYWDETSSEGWGAGARSIDELSADGVRVRFQVGQATGIVLGFAKAGVFAPENPASVEHAFYLFTQGAARLAAVMENGAQVGGVFARPADAVFEIRRWGGRVRYLMDGVEVFVSGVPSSGALIVGCCLYRTGDEVG